MTDSLKHSEADGLDPEFEAESSQSPPTPPAEGTGDDTAEGTGDDTAESFPGASNKGSGVLADLEDGFGHLLGAFEMGVLNIASAEGRKRAERAAAESEISERPEGQADENADNEGRSARHGMTYEEALSPIRWGRFFTGLVAVILLGALYWGVTFVQVWASTNDVDTVAADAIVVLGAAQFDGMPSPTLAARLDRARSLRDDGMGHLIITTGSNLEGDRFTEGFSGFVYLRQAGVPEESILNVIDGSDTYQQLSAVAAQLGERDLYTVLLVSEGFHTHRLRSIADEIGLQAWVAPTSVEATGRDLVRETTAVAIGRLASYRRLSAWMNPETDEAVP